MPTRVRRADRHRRGDVRGVLRKSSIAVSTHPRHPEGGLQPVVGVALLTSRRGGDRPMNCTNRAITVGRTSQITRPMTSAKAARRSRCQAAGEPRSRAPDRRVEPERDEERERDVDEDGRETAGRGRGDRGEPAERDQDAEAERYRQRGRAGPTRTAGTVPTTGCGGTTSATGHRIGRNRGLRAVVSHAVRIGPTGVPPRRDRAAPDFVILSG